MAQDEPKAKVAKVKVRATQNATGEHGMEAGDVKTLEYTAEVQAAIDGGVLEVVD